MTKARWIAAVAWALAVAVLLEAGPALACPSCATREGPGAATLALVAVMIAIPYVVATVTIRVIRRLARDEPEPAATADKGGET